MRSGSPILFDIALYDTAGAGLSYADKTAFEGAGWSLTFIDMSTGSAVSPTISYTIAPVAGVTGRHVVQCTLTATAWQARITPPSASYSFQLVPALSWTGETYDTDSIFARVNSIYGIQTVTSLPTGVARPMVESDSYACTLQVPTAYLTSLGWTNLTGATLTGTIRRSSDDGTGTAAADLVTGSPTSAQGKVAINSGDATKVDVTWTTYPTGMALTSPERAAGGAAFRISVEATLAGKQLTVLYYFTLQVSRKENLT